MPDIKTYSIVTLQSTVHTIAAINYCYNLYAPT